MPSTVCKRPWPERSAALVTAGCALCALATVACSAGSDGTDPEPGAQPDAWVEASSGHDAGPEVTPGPDAMAGPDADLDAHSELDSPDAATPAFTIAFDTRFDTKGLVDEPTRAVLNAAAQKWSEVLLDEFPDVPAGTEVLARDPQTPSVAGKVFVYDQPIDDLVVFVGFAALDGEHGSLALSAPSAAIGSVSDPVLRAALQQRFEGPDFEPWTGWLGFDEAEDWFVDPSPLSSDDLPSGSMDLMSVALHELGHVLGVGTSDAFLAWVKAGSFTGPHAVALHGGPVPLSGDGRHIAMGILSDGRRPVMDPSDKAGERSELTALDLAILKDIGYQSAR